MLTHRELRPPVKTVRSGTKNTIPEWQVAITSVVEDMESHEMQAVTEPEVDGEDPDLPNSQDDVQLTQHNDQENLE